MKEIVVVSGKGGTGKTMFSANLAYLTENKIMADCDVDAANLYLLLKPEIKEKGDFISAQKCFIEEDKCIGCGRCQEVCRFEAVVKEEDKFRIKEITCEGCGACKLACPQEAINSYQGKNGEWFISDTEYGPFVYARLGILEENSGRLVTLVKEKARNLALEKRAEYIIVDGPPGIGCPLISSLSGANLALIITEPSLSAISDLERLLSVCSHFRLPALVIINKFDINEDNTDLIAEKCRKRNVEVVGKVPFDRDIPLAIAAQKILVKENPQNSSSQAILSAWKNIRRFL